MANKVAIITGASRGLGLVLVGQFTKNGWQVVGMGRSEQSAEFPIGAVYRQFDAGDVVTYEAFWKNLVAERGDAEVCLVNNAGGYVSGSLLDAKPEDYEQQMRGIFFGSVYDERFSFVCAKG